MSDKSSSGGANLPDIDNIVCLTWNIEGYSRSSLEIRQIVDVHCPDLIFLSEPWLFQPDLQLASILLNNVYKMFLNSDDLYDPELPLLQTRAHGGTLTLWKAELDPFITVLPSQSSRISTVVLDPPGIQTTVHINIYLPTSGRDSDFIDTLATLQATIDDVGDQYPSALIYVKGDANASISPRPGNKHDRFSSSFVMTTLSSHCVSMV